MIWKIFSDPSRNEVRQGYPVTCSRHLKGVLSMDVSVNAIKNSQNVGRR